jgi:signal transduction histidine kinase/CheY-like chemotaxis protein
MIMSKIGNIELFNDLSNGVLVLTEDMVVGYWNDWLSVNTGIRAVEIVGKKLDFFFPDIDLSRLSKKMDYSKKLKSPSYYHAFLDKYLIPIDNNKLLDSHFEKMRQDVVISYLPDYESFLIVITDNTNHLEIEYKLKENNKKLEHLAKSLEKYSETKSSFLTNTSHELRTPLSSMLGFIDLIKATGLTPEQKSYIDIIEDSSNAMLNIVNSVMTLSEVERGVLLNKPVECNLFDTVRSATELFYAKAVDKFIELSCYIDLNIPSKILFDSSKLRQMIINLVSNSIKFTDKGGSVKVAVELQEIEGSTAFIKISVEDDGAGMDSDFQKQMFQPFERDKKNIYYEGSGVGLNICSNFANILNTEIAVKSEVGKGSCFSFLIEAEILDAKPILDFFDAKDARYGLFAVGEDDYVGTLLRKYLNTLNKEFYEYQSVEDLRENGDKSDIVLVAGCSKLCKSGVELEKISCGKIICFSSNLCGLVRKAELKEKVLRYKGIFDPKSICLVISEAIDSLDNGLEKNAKEKVLVMEDNYNSQQLMKVVFKKIGVDVDVAPNGEAGYIMFKKNNYSLILIDINMPIMDGMETVSEIRKYAAVNNMILPPVYALTAHFFEEKKEEIMSHGFDGYFTKPVEIKALKALLRNTLVSYKEGDSDEASIIATVRENMLKYSELDWNHVKVLLESFFSLIFKDLDEMKKFIDSGEHVAISRKSHYIRGQLMNFYLKDVASLLNLIEEEGTSKKDRIAVFDKIEEYISKANREFTKLKNE